uniref:Uncharacterized protein n=1 Tax=Cannabis sativa TaxID=3483 RepID=A0A803QSE5_CANSA
SVWPEPGRSYLGRGYTQGRPALSLVLVHRRPSLSWAGPSRPHFSTKLVELMH